MTQLSHNSIWMTENLHWHMQTMVSWILSNGLIFHSKEVNMFCESVCVCVCTHMHKEIYSYVCLYFICMLCLLCICMHVQGWAIYTPFWERGLQWISQQPFKLLPNSLSLRDVLENYSLERPTQFWFATSPLFKTWLCFLQFLESFSANGQYKCQPFL